MGRLGKTKWCLLGCLIVVFVFLITSIFAPDRLTGGVRWVADNDFAGRLRALSEQEVYKENSLTEMAVETIVVSEIDYQPVVILKEKDGELYLPIWIGILEANAISAVLGGVNPPRPLTADLLCSILETVEASVGYVVIYDLQDNTYYANIILHTHWTQVLINARPSDAIAIALRVKAPIYATKALLEKAGVSPEQEIKGKYVALPSNS